jgi:hypothetical protein
MPSRFLALSVELNAHDFHMISNFPNYVIMLLIWLYLGRDEHVRFPDMSAAMGKNDRALTN